jgi:hypothetical protein
LTASIDILAQICGISGLSLHAFYAYFLGESGRILIDFTAMKQRNRVRDDRRFSDDYISRTPKYIPYFRRIRRSIVRPARGTPIILGQTPAHVYSRHAATGMRESKTSE